MIGMMGVTLFGVTYNTWILGKRLESHCSPKQLGGPDFYDLTNVSFLSRHTRALKNCDNLPQIPRCICEYCSQPPEERCIR